MDGNVTITINEPEKQRPYEIDVNVKKKKLTKEGRLELKKQKKVIKKQTDLELKRQQFRDYLERELKYTRKTYRRAAADWEAMCAGIKLKDLQDDMQELWQSLNRKLDTKNHKLELLTTELDTAEKQYSRNFSKHADVLEYLIKLYKLFIGITKQAYEKDAAGLVSEFEDDLSDKNEIHGFRKRYYENVLHATNLMTKNIFNKMQNNFVMEQNEVQDTHIAERLYFRDDTIRNMKQLRAHTVKIIEDLQCDALNPKQEELYSMYVDRHKIATRECAIFQETSKRLLTTVSSYQAELMSSEGEMNLEIVKLRGERSYFLEHYRNLKQIYKESLKERDDHLRILAFESHKTITELKKIGKYGELLLGLAACCRKLQTEREKITPWPDLVVDTILESSKQVEEASEDLLDQMRPMQLFWNRIVQAETEVLCLKEEKRVLRHENENLRQLLKSCVEGQAYNKLICSLKISPYPTLTIPVQEASHMPQLKKL